MVPSHQAGIYGLAEGGNIRLQPHTASDLLVQKTLSGERPKYQPPGRDYGPAHHGDVAHGPGGRFNQPAPADPWASALGTMMGVGGLFGKIYG